MCGNYTFSKSIIGFSRVGAGTAVVARHHVSNQNKRSVWFVRSQTKLDETILRSLPPSFFATRQRELEPMHGLAAAALQQPSLLTMSIIHPAGCKPRLIYIRRTVLSQS